MDSTKLETRDEILSFIHNYCNFGLNRVYILVAIARPKEHIDLSYGDRPMFRKIISDESEIDKQYNKITGITKEYNRNNNDKFKFRLYLTVNARDTDRALYLYQKHILELQRHASNGHKESHNKIKRMDSEWKSMLEKDTNKDDSYFILDFDDASKSELKQLSDEIKTETDIEVLDIIDTPNGFHLITEPFNYAECNTINNYNELSAETDDLLFLSMIDEKT